MAAILSRGGWVNRWGLVMHIRRTGSSLLQVMTCHLFRRWVIPWINAVFVLIGSHETLNENVLKWPQTGGHFVQALQYVKVRTIPMMTWCGHLTSTEIPITGITMRRKQSLCWNGAQDVIPQSALLSIPLSTVTKKLNTHICGMFGTIDAFYIISGEIKLWKSWIAQSLFEKFNYYSL